MRVAIIYPPRSAAPFEAGPLLLEAMGRWVETYSTRFSTLELNRILAENPFTPFMDVEIMPVVEPRAAMANFREAVTALVATAQPSG